jgi:hypothetical protein
MRCNRCIVVGFVLSIEEGAINQVNVSYRTVKKIEAVFEVLQIVFVRVFLS